MSHTQYPGRPRTVADLTEKHKEYIVEHHKEKTVSEMSALRNIPTRVIYAFLNENDLQSLNNLERKKSPVSSKFFDGRSYGGDVFI